MTTRILKRCLAWWWAYTSTDFWRDFNQFITNPAIKDVECFSSLGSVLLERGMNKLIAIWDERSTRMCTYFDCSNDTFCEISATRYYLSVALHPRITVFFSCHENNNFYSHSTLNECYWKYFKHLSQTGERQPIQIKSIITTVVGISARPQEFLLFHETTGMTYIGKL